MPDTSSQVLPLRRLGIASVALLVLLSIAGWYMGLGKLLVIAWTAFVAMAAGTWLGNRVQGPARPRALVWSYGMASGTMITSAAVFLIPDAIGHDPSFGGFGIALGVVSGFAIHAFTHQLTHLEHAPDSATTELTLHALADGCILGAVYAAMPDLGPLVGLAIISHKAPAGYAVARRLTRRGRSTSRLLLPAAAVGIAALPAGMIAMPEGPVFNALFVGFATGVFLHVALDFLPRCELGSEVYEAAQLSEEGHHLLDRLRFHAVGSTAAGGLLVYLLWTLLS